MMPSSRRKLGLVFIITPPACIVAAPILFTIINFVLSSFVSQNEGEGMMMVARLVNVLLGLVGFIGLVGLFTLLPIGLYLFFSTPRGAVSTQIPPQT